MKLNLCSCCSSMGTSGLYEFCHCCCCCLSSIGPGFTHYITPLCRSTQHSYSQLQPAPSAGWKVRSFVDDHSMETQHSCWVTSLVLGGGMCLPLSSRNFCVSRFWQLLRRSKELRNTKNQTERFLITQNRTESKFSRESSSSKPRTIQKQTNNVAAASWVLREECVHEIGKQTNKQTNCYIFWISHIVTLTRSFCTRGGTDSSFPISSCPFFCHASHELRCKPIVKPNHPGRQYQLTPFFVGSFVTVRCNS